MPTFTAVDLGATSGRVVAVRADVDTIELDVVHRFPMRAVDGAGGALFWDFESMLAEVTKGLAIACQRGTIESIGIDSWAVDYGLLDANGDLLGPVHAYRSARTAGVMDRVIDQIGRDRIYATTGIQFLPFNTIFQLVAARSTTDYRDAARLLMVPDLINHTLCGSTTGDVTNASTTQLLDVKRRQWSSDLIAELGLRRELMPELHEPGRELGTVRGTKSPADGVTVRAVASHDTASAVAGVPLLATRPGVYISCGTWSLVGAEVRRPVTTPDALEANVTNELGVDNSVRLLKNVTGLWLLEECRRVWSAQGVTTTAESLAAEAAAVPGGLRVIDPDDPRFTAPGDMPQRIVDACVESGQPAPESPAEIARTIFDSLALSWRATVRTIERIAGFDADVVHLVGGGSSIPLLRDLCASACARPVLAGPAEATVAGNGLMQGIAAGLWSDVLSARLVLETALPPTEVLPARTLDWERLADRVSDDGS